jgi:hypothetical protein
MGALGRTLVVAYTISWVMFLLLIMLCGFVLAKGTRLLTYSCNLELEPVTCNLELSPAGPQLHLGTLFGSSTKGFAHCLLVAIVS